MREFGGMKKVGREGANDVPRFKMTSEPVFKIGPGKIPARLETQAYFQQKSVENRGREGGKPFS